MKEQISDANFPKTSDSRVYHLGIRAGELASLIITVGDPARARIIAKYLDSPPPNAAVTEYEKDASDAHITLSENANPALFELYSDRGFLTLTGTYKGIPVSIVSIGMGAPNMDFFVREGREVLDQAGQEEMVVIRFGSCGGLASSLTVGSLVVPKASVGVTRNYDFDFRGARTGSEGAYRISKPAPADEDLHSILTATLKEALPSNIIIDDNYLNASADSFYSSQGRITSFPDHNEGLIENLIAKGVGSLEMETFHLLHLANSWPRPDHDSTEGADQAPAPPTGMPASSLVFPSSTLPTSDAMILNTKTSEPPAAAEEEDDDADLEETILYPHSSTITSPQANTPPPQPFLNLAEVAASLQPTVEEAPPASTATWDPQSRRRIRAAAVQMIFAERGSRAFISPGEVETLQEGTARGLLDTLVKWHELSTPKGEGVEGEKHVDSKKDEGMEEGVEGEKKVDDTEDTGNTDGVEKVETGDAEKVETVEEAKEMENTEEARPVQDVEKTEKAERTE